MEQFSIWSKQTFFEDHSNKNIKVGTKEVVLRPSKLEKVVDPCSGPRGPLPEIGVHYLVLFSWDSSIFITGGDL